MKWGLASSSPTTDADPRPLYPEALPEWDGGPEDPGLAALSPEPCVLGWVTGTAGPASTVTHRCLPSRGILPALRRLLRWELCSP